MLLLRTTEALPAARNFYKIKFSKIFEPLMRIVNFAQLRFEK
jgi:hypothetical protein